MSVNSFPGMDFYYLQFIKCTLCVSHHYYILYYSTLKCVLLAYKGLQVKMALLKICIYYKFL
jgi:hypothetical protein